MPEKEKTMQALQVIRPRTFERVSLPRPARSAGGDSGMLVRTRWVSLCGSDIPFFTGTKPTATYPLAPGAPIHECVGQVVSSGSTEFPEGAVVLAVPDGNLGLAEYFTAQASRAVLLPEVLASRDTCCLIQPIATVMNALDRLGDLSGRSAAVVGLGSMGLFFLWLLRQAGAGRLVGIDPDAGRGLRAQALGAERTYACTSLELVHAVHADPGGWEPPDLVIEAVGHQMGTLNDCLELVRPRGTVLAFGVPDQTVYALEYETFFRKNLELVASVTPDWKAYLGRARDLVGARQAELETWVTHRLPIREAGRAFDLYERHADGIVKVVLDADGW